MSIQQNLALYASWYDAKVTVYHWLYSTLAKKVQLESKHKEMRQNRLPTPVGQMLQKMSWTTLPPKMRGLSRLKETKKTW